MVVPSRPDPVVRSLNKSHVASFAVSLPELFHVVVAVLGDDHRPFGRVMPDEHAQFVRVVFEHVKVGLRQELIVQDTLVEVEPVALQLPQFDLVGDGRR